MASSSNSSAPEIVVSTSSSLSIPKSFKYDVFLSFRGEDTRKNFVGHLYQALEAKGIETYKDDEKIEQGERINDQLLKSIQESRFFIIVFSKTYASSSWCLDELVKIMECQKMTEHTAFPVFYDVEPTQVRKQNGPVGEAFSKHENQEAAWKWRDAMKELADLAGWELKATANGDESKLIQMIVDAILIKKNSTLSNTDGKLLVGMETRISKVLSYLDIGTEDVRMIGIWGMGGGGKTTLARAVYDQISNRFEGKSFVQNVRDVSQPSLSGLKKLQKRILKDVLNKQDITFSSVHDGKNMLKATMCRRKVLVVLDDVDSIEQLEALAGEPDWFKSGSIIIITTRDEHVLKAHRVPVNFIHDVNLLSHKEALCLFSRYAFQKEIPMRGYEDLSGQVVQYANGLPLTIKVLGSFLCGKDKLIWVEAIKRLKHIPWHDTMVKLELSYDGLQPEYKEIFLNIACIFKGQTKEDAIRILESCGFYARNGLEVLKQRSLITISKHRGVLGMHDHIEEMGKNIVRREHPDEPYKHSRLWIREEIEDILANDKGTEETRYLKLDMLRGNYRIRIGKMKKLQYLEVKFAYHVTSELIESTQYLPNSLKYLKFENYPFSYLPKTFQANNLVGLGIRDSRMTQLWEEGEKKLMPVCCQSLKHLDISGSKIRTFDLGLTPNLERLYLFNCADFVELHVSVACSNLKILNLGYTRLRSLDLKLIPNLEWLDLEKCNKLVKINAPVGCLEKVVHLNLSGCLRFTYFVFGGRREPKDNSSSATLNLVGESLDLCPLHPNSNLPKLRFRCDYEEDLPSSGGNIEKLISFGLCACTDLKKFSDMICSLQCLKKLELQGSIPEFPEDLGQLKCLEELYLSSTKIKHLPDSICMLKRLKSLEVNNGDLLEKLSEDLGQLECLEMLHVRSKKIQFLPESICLLKRLKYLILDRCALLEKLPEDLGLLECLEVLVITDTGISHLPQSIFGLKGLLIAASPELLQKYNFPLEIKTTTSSIRHEAKFINVEEISIESRSINFGFVEKFVGMETRLRDVVSYLEVGTDEVRMIGVRGMGGAGKTTIARAVFDHLAADFEAKIFVENVREVSNGSASGLKNLQEQVLSKVLNERVTLYRVTEGKKMMEERMRHIKVLLVLDDVDHIEQLEALAGNPNWFKTGSRILITTRDEQVLEVHRMNFIRDDLLPDKEAFCLFIRDIDLLSDKEAICLFSRYAFGTENPLQGYEELSGKVVRYAAGLPLTVEVMGSFLCGKDKDDWEDAIDRIKRIPLKETLEQLLEISYMILEDDYKEVFLDIACILKGKSREDAIRILKCCGFPAIICLKILEQRSLITVDDFRFLGMHDHIEEMGKNIVRQSHPDEPNKHSRLWINEEIEEILANDKGTEETRCLRLNKSRLNAGIVMKGLGKMKKLRYLEVKFASYGPYQKTSDAECLDDTSQYFSNSLKYLKCTNYPFLYLPRTFQANNLVGLEMHNSGMVQLWEEGEKKVLKRLRYLSFFKSMLTNFDFGMTPNLETLFLRDSPNLVELCMPYGCQTLKHLDISDSKLRTFDLGLTPNLEKLSLDACADFEELQVSDAFPSLKSLSLRVSRLRSLDLELIPNLERLDLINCAQFEELHVCAACPNLKFLNLQESRLRSLDLELIPNLEILDLQYSKELVEINFGCLKYVVHLYLDDCVLLEKLPEDIGRFKYLEELVITNTRISHLPQSIFGLKGLYLAASPELLQKYDFPSEIKTTTRHIRQR